jgi:hypothetical protein
MNITDIHTRLDELGDMAKELRRGMRKPGKTGGKHE